MIYIELRSLGDSFRIRRSEWGLAFILALGWGYIPLLIQGNSFGGPSLAWLTSNFSETTWALICLVIGVSRLAVLIVNGSWRRCSHGRMVTAALSMLVWMSVFISILRAGNASPGIVTYLVFLLMDGHTIFEAARDARAVDDKRHAARA